MTEQMIPGGEIQRRTYLQTIDAIRHITGQGIFSSMVKVGETYERIDGVIVEQNLNYDANGNLTEIILTLSDGTRIRKSLGYDANGNLTSISAWEKI